tara:strand:+ start:1665 stop:2063 length:399 start_codon:yes stop_codon:yes gene_type:complete
MEIKDYKELNALNRLLGKVKFQSDLDFYEFKEFVGSPIIAEIFRRLQDEYWNESVKLGYVEKEQKPKFEFDGLIGKTLRMRIDELTEQDRETLLDHNSLESYVNNLISPLEAEESEVKKMIFYAKRRIISNS